MRQYSDAVLLFIHDPSVPLTRPTPELRSIALVYPYQTRFKLAKHSIISIFSLATLPLKMENTAMSDRWLSVEDIAAYLGVSKDTIYVWIAKRSMPAHRVGRFWKFQKSEVDLWVKADGANDIKASAED